jgi:hypothetical protein
MDKYIRRVLGKNLRENLDKIQRAITLANIEITHDLDDGVDWVDVKSQIAQAQECLERIAYAVDRAASEDHG